MRWGEVQKKSLAIAQMKNPDNCETKFWQLHSIQIEAPPEGVASIDKSSQGRFRYIGTRSGT